MQSTAGPLRPLLICWLLLMALVPACSDEGADAPYVEFVGGGFIFNYRLGEAHYGFVVKALRDIPPGTILEAQFENPSGDPPLIVERTARAGFFQYSFETPPLQGVQADRDYHVDLRLLDPADRRLIAHYAKTYRSTLDQKVLPKQPLTVGPGYERNPELGDAAPSPAQ